jgi:dATP pyrophosphohydrolase
MSKKTRKAQVVICGYDAQSQSLSYLLLQTNQKRGEFWQNVTGKVDEGESYEEGALREVIEETKLDPRWIVHFTDLGLSHDFIDEKKRDVHERAYLILIDRIFRVTIDPHEHQNYRWEKVLSRSVVKHEGNFEALVKAEKLLREEYT